MDCSTPGLPVPRHLPKFAQVHVHCIDDAIQPSPPLTPSFPSALNLSHHQGLFQCVGCLHQVKKNTGASVSASVLPMSIQGWCPLRRSGWICLQSKGLSGVFSSSTVQGHQFFGALLLLSSSHTPCDHWEDRNLGYVDLCRQGDVCPFQHTV